MVRQSEQEMDKENQNVAVKTELHNSLCSSEFWGFVLLV